MDILKISYLLVFKGIHPSEFNSIDSSLTKLSIQSTEQPTVSQIYSEIPKKFIDVESWPKFTNLKCWCCSRFFTTYPKFIPTNPEKTQSGKEICDPLGNFCEWNCPIRHIEKEFPKEQQKDAIELVLIFQEKFTGKRREKIMGSPDKTKMQQYCGIKGITEKQYQEEIDKLNVDYDLSSYKLDHFKVVQ
jgi:hypothetical protein